MPFATAGRSLKQAADIGRLAHFMTVAAGLALFGMMVLMTIHVVSRKLGLPVPGAFEVSEQFMVLVLTFPLAEISLKRGHVLVGIVSGRFPGLKRSIHLLGCLIGLLVLAPLTYKAWEIGLAMYAIGEYRQGMVDVPIWPFRLLLAAGLSLAVYELAVSALRFALSGKRLDQAQECPPALA